MMEDNQYIPICQLIDRTTDTKKYDTLYTAIGYYRKNYPDAYEILVKKVDNGNGRLVMGINRDYVDGDRIAFGKLKMEKLSKLYYALSDKLGVTDYVLAKTIAKKGNIPHSKVYNKLAQRLLNNINISNSTADKIISTMEELIEEHNISML